MMGRPSADEYGLLGKVMGRCRLTAYLGAGGMGCVYRAVHTTLHLPRAVKVLPMPSGPRAPQAVARFAREAQQTAKIRHPNIVGVYDFGLEGQYYFIEMEFVDGTDLGTVIAREGPLAAPRVAGIGADVAAALSAAHAAGLIHRDIKPSNILLPRGGGVKVVDFGLVKRVDDYGMVTREEEILGTPHYIPPEHWQGETVDTRADLYSLGCSLYEALTGRLPYEGSAASVMKQHLDRAVPDPRETRPDVPPRLAEIIMRCMAKGPEERYPTADALARDLRAFSDAQVTRRFERSPREVPRSVELLTAIDSGAPSPGQRPAASVTRPPAEPPSPARPVARVPGIPEGGPAAPRTSRRLRRLVRSPTVQVTCSVMLAGALVLLIATSGPRPTRDAATDSPPAADNRETPKEAEPPEGRPRARPEEVYIPAGEAQLGSAESKGANPPRSVHLAAFYIDKYEVTNARYQEFLKQVRETGDAAYAHPDQPEGKSHEPRGIAVEDLKKPDRPVVGVDWWDAYAYARWAGKRLPTEDEWERAARGATGRPYPWGASPVAEGALFRANCLERQRATKRLTEPPGTMKEDRSPDGCFDMAGNVMEWTGTTDPSRPGLKVIRGGAYSAPMALCVSYGKSWALPATADVGLGFRCARSAP